MAVIAHHQKNLFYTQTNNAFCDEILPLVKNAKLEFPIDSGDPANPQQYHFQDSHWGEEQEYPYAHQYASEHNTYIYDANNDDEYYPEKSYFDESCITMGRKPTKTLMNRLKVRKTIAPKEKACC